jgi:phage baseplate assembly protein gpV
MKFATLAIALSAIALPFVSLPSFAAKSCDELKTEIAAKLDAKSVAGYTLDIVANDQVGEQKVVGSCEGGTKKITYVRGAKTTVPTAPSEASAQ